MAPDLYTISQYNVMSSGAVLLRMEQNLPKEQHCRTHSDVYTQYRIVLLKNVYWNSKSSFLMEFRNGQDREEYESKIVANEFGPFVCCVGCKNYSQCFQMTNTSKAPTTMIFDFDVSLDITVVHHVPHWIWLRRIREMRYTQKWLISLFPFPLERRICRYVDGLWQWCTFFMLHWQTTTKIVRFAAFHSLCRFAFFLFFFVWPFSDPNEYGRETIGELTNSHMESQSSKELLHDNGHNVEKSGLPSWNVSLQSNEVK